jgi:hypothetical protein
MEIVMYYLPRWIRLSLQLGEAEGESSWGQSPSVIVPELRTERKRTTPLSPEQKLQIMIWQIPYPYC